MMNMMRVSITTPFVRTRHATNSVENSIPPQEGDRWTSSPSTKLQKTSTGFDVKQQLGPPHLWEPMSGLYLFRS